MLGHVMALKYFNHLPARCINLILETIPPVCDKSRPRFMISKQPCLVAWLTALAGFVAAPLFAAPVSATSADAFVDSVGVCTHWQYADTVYSSRFPELKARLLEAGLRHVRDGGANDTFIANTRMLAASGVRTTLMLDPGSGIVPDEKYWTPSSAPRHLLGHFVKNVLGTNAVAGVEVLNEIDLFYARDNFVHDYTQAGLFWAAGNTSPTNKLNDDRLSPLWWGRYSQAIAHDTYAAMKADPATRNIPVIGPSLGKTYGYDSKSPFGNDTLADCVDWGCFHPYPGGNPFSERDGYAGVDWYIGHGGQPSANLDEAKFAFDIYAPPFGKKPMCATETGYYTGTAKGAVSEAVQAKYVPRLFLEYFRLGISRTFNYELVDLRPDPRDDQACRGLLHNDLTPKPAFTALKNLIALLSDRGAQFKPGAMDYALTVHPPSGYNRTQYVRHQLFQKSDGSFWLALYHEIADSSSTTADGKEINGPTRELTHPDMPVVITFGPGVKLTRAETFLPQNSTNVVATLPQPRELKLNVPDQVLLVKLVPAR